MIDEIDLLLKQKWNEEEKELLDKMVKNLLYYKSLIPKYLKIDICTLLNMAISLKKEYDLFKEKCTCMETININHSNNDTENTENNIDCENVAIQLDKQISHNLEEMTESLQEIVKHLEATEASELK